MPPGDQRIGQFWPARPAYQVQHNVEAVFRNCIVSVHHRIGPERFQRVHLGRARECVAMRSALLLMFYSGILGLVAQIA